MGDRLPDARTMQNLKDAGCDGEMVRCYCELEGQDKRRALICKEQIRLLYTRRRAIVDELHERQEELACLDYLLFHLKERAKDEKP